MRSPQIVIGMMLVLVALAAKLEAAGPASASVWRTDPAQAMADAKRLNRPIVMHFGARWCAPCQKMEHETLKSPELLRILQVGFVAIKIDVEAHPDFQRRFQVENLPTDILLTPDGRVLSRTEGHQSKVDYLATVSRIDARYAASRQQVAQAPAKPAAAPAVPAAKAPIAPAPVAKLPPTPTPVAQAPTPKAPAAPVSVAQAPSKAPAAGATAAPGEKLPPKPIDPPALAAAEPPAKATLTKSEHAPASLALDGYCPVTLRTSRTWKPGQKEHACEHQGQIFYFASQKLVQDFKADPNRFAPRLLGCDPVVLSESDLAVLGSTQYGAFYDGELYLFESAETRARFRANPARYSRTKHVLSPTDVKKRRA